MEDDKKVKKKSIVFLSLLFCTFLSFNPNFQQLVKLSNDHFLISKEGSPIKNVWSKIIKVDKQPLNQTVPASTVISNSLSSEKLEVSYKLFGIFPLSKGEVEVMKPDAIDTRWTIHWRYFENKGCDGCWAGGSCRQNWKKSISC